MSRFTTLEFNTPDMYFCAGHFAIFDDKRRAKLHGHNYFVHAQITAPISDNGLAIEFGQLNTTLCALCKQLDEIFILPSENPYLSLDYQGEHCYAHYNGEKIPFLQSDILVLPICNVTAEELSQWLLSQLLADEHFQQYQATAITIKVSSLPWQFASASWEKDL